MDIFYSKFNQLSGTSYKEIKNQADRLFTAIKNRTKRRPYLRSAYFGKEKIFFDYFWAHLNQKSYFDRARRLKLFPSSVELIKNSRLSPEISLNRHCPTEELYRFMGMTADGQLFILQIKENKKTGQKFFMSCFPKD